MSDDGLDVCGHGISYDSDCAQCDAIERGHAHLAAMLADALHAQIDGDFLVAASRWEKGADVALSTASATEVVWWAVNAVAPAVRAHLAGTLDAAREDVARALAGAGVLSGKSFTYDEVTDVALAALNARLTPTDGAP